MNLRRFGINDFNNVCMFWEETIKMGIHALDDSAEEMENFLARNPNTNFVAELNDKIVGDIICGCDGWRGYIYHIAARQDLLSKGLGEKLVGKAILSLKQAGIKEVVLDVSLEDEFKDEFYKSIGIGKFKELSLRENNIEMEL